MTAEGTVLEQQGPQKAKQRYVGAVRGRKKPARLLVDLRAVAKQPKEQDKPGMQVKLRQMYEKDFKGFLALLSQHERAHRQGAGKTVAGTVGAATVAPPPAEVDLGEEKCVALIEKLLADFEATNP